MGRSAVVSSRRRPRRPRRARCASSWTLPSRSRSRRRSARSKYAPVDADEVSNSMKTFTSSVAQQPGRKQEPQQKKRDNLDNQQIIYTHEAQPKSTPRRLKTKLRKRRSKSQSPSAIHRVERQSIKKMEELRRNAVSSLGNHKEEENLNSDKKKQISPSQVREVKEKIGGGQPKYLEKKISNAER